MEGKAKVKRIPIRYHEDDRAVRYCDIFPSIEIGGDINVSVVYPGTVALWHRHKRQDDYQLVVKGALKIGVCNLPARPCSSLDLGRYEYLFDNYKETLEEMYHENHRDQLPDLDDWPFDVPTCQWHVLSERNVADGPLFIPRGLWHGCYNFTNEPAILIYHITSKYTGLDEDRTAPEEMGYDWKVSRK